MSPSGSPGYHAVHVPSRLARPLRHARQQSSTLVHGAAVNGPLYRGEPLEAARGPGLGCFWFQVAVLAILLVATPLSVAFSAPPWLSGALLIVTIVLLLFVGQTIIFLLRLVAADRRTRRRPLGTDARRTVGELEDEARVDRTEDDRPG